MNIIIENLMAMSCEGAFGTRRQIKPMSEFKWNVLYKIATIEDVAPFIGKALTTHEDDLYANVPPMTKDLLVNATFNGKDNLNANFDIEDIDRQNLSYALKRYTLKDIAYKERHSIDTSKTTLDLLAVILQNANLILRKGIRLRGIIELGLFLRTKGQLVDFVKLESWIDKLKLKKMARLEASVLIQMFGFERDEFPYIRKTVDEAGKLTEESLRRVVKANKLDRATSKYNIRNCITFYRYSHSEAICKATSTIVRSLSEIEE